MDKYKQFLQALKEHKDQDVYSKDEFEMLVKIAIMSDSDFNEMYSAIQEEDGAWSLTAFDKHCELSGIYIDKRARFIIFYVCESAIGKMVKALKIITDYCETEGINKVTYETFYQKIFAHGFDRIK